MDFEVIMNTHSVELTQYNVSEQSELIISGQVAQGTFQWESVNNDPHHMKGYLKWEGNTDLKGPFTLNIKGIDDIDSRHFTWNL